MRKTALTQVLPLRGNVLFLSLDSYQPLAPPGHIESYSYLSAPNQSLLSLILLISYFSHFSCYFKSPD